MVPLQRQIAEAIPYRIATGPLTNGEALSLVRDAAPSPYLSMVFVEKRQAMKSPMLTVASCCCAVVLAGGCASAPLDFPRTESFAFSSPQETALGRNFYPQSAAHPGQTGAYLLPSGPDALVARAVLIDAAEKSIDVKYFIFDDDMVSDFLLDHIVAAADRGVRVRMLLDDFCQAGQDRRLAGIGAHPNIELRVFNPVGGNRSMKAFRGLNYLFGPKRIRSRMHNKALIVDAAAVIVGGRNIADEYFSAHAEFNFSDVDMIAIGEVVGDVARAFDTYWNAPLAIPIEAFVPTEQGPECLAELRSRLENSRVQARESDYAQRVRESGLLKQVEAHAVPFTWGQGEALADAPDKSLKKREQVPSAFIGERLLAAMSSARREVLMVSPYFVPGKAGMEWFREARDRGITVKMVTNSLASTNHAAAHGGYERYRKAVLREGVELYELRPDPQRTGKPATIHRGSTARAALHAKMLIIDRETIFVGSYNIDPRSGQLDSQNGILIHCPKLAAQLAGIFNMVTAPDYSYRVTLDGNRLTWTSEKAGHPIEYHKEPETSGWRRFKATIIGRLAPESWL